MKESLDLLLNLIKIYSPSRNERKASEYLSNWMKKKGFRTWVDEVGNCIGQIGNGRFHLFLLGHIDTVEGEIPIRIENNNLYGRGSVDAKGPLCAFAFAASQFINYADLTITVAGAVEEEAATSKGARFLLKNFTPNAVIIGEPSGWEAITLGYKGRLLMNYHISTPMTHSASDSKTPGEIAFDMWSKIQNYCANFNKNKKMFDQINPSIRSINSGKDYLVQWIDMVIGFRLPLGFDIESFKELIYDWAKGAKINFYGEEKAFKADKKNNPLVTAFNRAIKEDGGRALYKVKSGTSDMNVVGPVWECPIVAYGPGDSSLDHTPNEHININEYYKSINILRKVIKIYGEISLVHMKSD